MENNRLITKDANTKKTGFYKIAGTTLKIPLIVITGKNPGKTLLITAGIHGSEYPGIEACKRLSKLVNPNTIQGRIILLPCMNPNAFFERSAFVNPTDGKNLNRSFPGNKNGTETEKIAYALAKDFFPEADFYLDLHSGDLPEVLSSFVFIPGFGKQEVLQQAISAASYLDLNYGVKSVAKTGAYNYACLQGLPSLLVERGGYGGRESQHIEGFLKDIFGVMEYLELIPQKNRSSQLTLLDRSFPL